jgi:hypothetical protein
MSSLPVPVSPVINTVESVGATFATCASTLRTASDDLLEHGCATDLFAQGQIFVIGLLFSPLAVVDIRTRTAVVVNGLWYFGYGPKNEQALVKALPPGAFYTEPAGESHFARTGPEGATVSITGYGPTDTVYAK